MDPDASSSNGVDSGRVGSSSSDSGSSGSSIGIHGVGGSSCGASRSNSEFNSCSNSSICVDTPRVAGGSSGHDSHRVVDSSSGYDRRRLVDGSSSRDVGVDSHRAFRDKNPVGNASNDAGDNLNITALRRLRKRDASDENETIDNIEIDGNCRVTNRIGSVDNEVAVRNRIDASRTDAVRFYHLGPGLDLNITAAIMKDRRRELNRRIRQRVHTAHDDIVVEQNIENNTTVNNIGVDGSNAHYNLYLQNQEGVIDIEDFIRLLGTNVDANVGNNVAIHVVDENFNALLDDVSNNNVDAAKQYIEAGYDVNKTNNKGHNLLSAAALKNNISIMEMLITAGASINAVNRTGSTALIQAAHFGHVDAVRLLLDSHASCDIVNNNGTSALMRASQEGRVDIAKMLLNANADVNRKNIEGMSALMLASQRNHAEVVSLLIQAGAFCDDQTVQGSTALMLASKRGHVACVDVLITMGAEVHILDSRDRTARDSALRKNFSNVLPYLDTQFQMNRMRQCVCIQRSHFIGDCRNAYTKGNLQLRYDPNLPNKSTSSSHLITFNTPERFNYLKKTNSDVICSVHAAGSVSYSTVNTLLKLKASIMGNHRQRFEHDDHHWPLILIKCMALPNGVFELINEFLPLPRMWDLSLRRLRQRCKLAPRQAMVDLCIISDEILADCCIFSSMCQDTLPIRISRNPIVYHELKMSSMSSTALEIIDYIADIQAILSRTLDSEVTFKPQLAKKLLSHVTTLCRWYNKDSCVEQVSKISDDTTNALWMSGVDTETEADAPDLDDDESDNSNND